MRPRVLVVDDEPLIHSAIIEVLDFCDVQATESWTDAIALMDQLDHIDVALVDKNLPGRSGLTLIPEIKARHPFAEVLVITGYPTMESAIEAMESGACDFVPKPFDFGDLRIKVTNAANARVFDARCKKVSIATASCSKPPRTRS